MQYTFGHKPIKKITLVAFSYRLRYFVVIHISYITAPSLIVRGQVIGTDTI